MRLTVGVVMILLAALELSSAVVIWEFGEDVPGSTLMFQATGVIRFWNKVTRVPINVAPNMKVVYVRVEIQNPISNPAVTYKKISNTVLIEYGLLQYSKSRYEVIAKAMPTQCEPTKCGETNIEIP